MKHVKVVGSIGKLNEIQPEVSKQALQHSSNVMPGWSICSIWPLAAGPNPPIGLEKFEQMPTVATGLLMTVAVEVTVVLKVAVVESVSTSVVEVVMNEVEVKVSVFVAAVLVAVAVNSMVVWFILVVVLATV